MNKVLRAQALAILVGGALMAFSYLPETFQRDGDLVLSTSRVVNELGKVEKICETLHSPNGALKISLSIVPDELRNYQNVFQTSNLNNGLRLEIDEGGTTALILGEPNSSAIVANGLQTRLVPLRETKIEIEVSQKYGSSINIPEENLPVIRTSYGKLLPACDNVRVGIGFDDTRKFSGTVEIRFQYGTWRQIFPLPSWAKNFGLIIVIIAMMSWAVGDTYRPEDANEDSLEFGETDVSQ
jgi:hypothetical protein